jgi:hypothetical protein
VVESLRLTPPSSRGLGRGPLKAKTGVRVPLGAHTHKNRSTDDVERFLSSIQFENREKLEEFGLKL